MEFHTATQHTGMSLAQELQRHLSNESREYGITYNIKHKKGQGKKWTNMDYHVQYDKYVKHQGVKMYCATNQFPELKFLGPHKKPHCVSGLGKHYHICFHPKLGHGTYAIHRIHFAFDSCTYSLEQPWIPSFPAQQQPRYQPIKYFP